MDVVAAGGLCTIVSGVGAKLLPTNICAKGRIERKEALPPPK